MTLVQGDNASHTVPVSFATKDRAVVYGTVSFPWGTVAGGTITVGDMSVKSDSAGKYEISLPQGSHDIVVQVPFPGYETQIQRVEVAAGETKVVDIYVDFVKAIVEGYVYDLDGKPVAGATLSGVQCGKDMATATTDEHGHFRFENVTPGDRHIRVNAEGYMGEVRDFAAKQSEKMTLDFRLTRTSCKVYGIVTDENNKPLQVQLALTRSGVILARTMSDAKTGRYEFNVAPGTYRILPSVPRREMKPWEGSISADTRIDFNLPPLPTRTVIYGLMGAGGIGWPVERN